MFYLMGWDGWMDGMGWMGWDGVSKVSFNFLYTLWVYRSCICILIYIVKSCHQHSYGFQNSMSSWGVGVRFSKLPYSHDFFNLRVCWMFADGVDGLDGMGWTGYQTCPSIFFILCRYIDQVYIYSYT